MKATCQRDKLLAAFQTAASVAPLRSPKPILTNVKIEATADKTTLLATDLELGIRIDVSGIEVETPGSAVLSIGRFGSILRESSDATLRLETDGQHTIVRGERSEFKLASENPDEFPAVPSFSEEKYHELPARLFKEMIRRTIFATDNESTRYALGGVLFEFGAKKVIAVATDGRRLAKMEGPGQAIGGHGTTTNASGSTANATIIPAKALQLIDRAISDADAEIQIAARENDVLVRSPRVTIYSRLVEGRFPRWRDVFPVRNDSHKIPIAVGPFYAAVRQAMIVTSEESRGVDFKFGEGNLTMSARVAEVGQARVELPIGFDGAQVAIMLDPRYVVDCLKVIDNEQTITLDLLDDKTAAVLLTDDGYGYVIMPLARDR